MITTLRDYQAETLTQIKRCVSQGQRRVMVQAPTGSGKTKIAAAIVLGAVAKSNRVAFTVPFITLIDQTCRSFLDEGLESLSDVAVIQAQHEWSNQYAPVQVCSLDTLARRGEPAVDVVIVDEAHRHNRFLYQWMEREPDKIFIGLTATPWSKGLGKHWQQLLIGTTTQGLIDREYLSPFRVFAPSAPDLEGLRVVAGEWEQKELGKRVSETKLIASIVDTWIERAERRPTILYGVNRAHAKLLQQQFINQNVNAGYMDAHTPIDEREALRVAFHAGDIAVMCNVGVLVAGVDWDVRCVVLACPTRSEIKFVQMVGRGLRTAAGKGYCLVLDHSDTHERLGFVTDIHHQNLDTGEKVKSSEREEPTPKPCPSCAFIMPPKTLTCPQCGFQRQAQANVKEEAGELIELNAKKSKYTPAEKRQKWAELRWIAQETGKNPGWVYWTCKEWCGAPRDTLDITPLPPTEETRKYVKHKLIRYIKSRQARQKSAG